MAYVEYEADGKTIKARVQQKTDTLANWMANDNIVLAGEQAFVVNDDGTPLNFKIGDGTKPFRDLPNWIDFSNAQRVSSVAPGVLPAGPDEETRYMEVTAIGTYTYGGNTLATITEDGYKATFWWTGTEWVSNGVVRVKGDEVVPDGDIEIGDNSAVSGDTVGRQIDSNTRLPIIQGKYINAIGERVNDVGQEFSEYVFINNFVGVKILCRGTSTIPAIFFYDINRLPLGVLMGVSSQQTITLNNDNTPIGTKYVRYNSLINQGGLITTEVNKRIDYDKSFKSVYTYSGFINAINGNITSDSFYVHTDLIKITSDLFVSNCYSNGGTAVLPIIYFNKDKAIIPQPTNTKPKGFHNIDVNSEKPIGAVYIKVNGVNSYPLELKSNITNLIYSLNTDSVNPDEYVKKEIGKGLSQYDYSAEDKIKVSKINITGVGTKVLADNGQYVELNESGDVIQEIKINPDYINTINSASAKDILVKPCVVLTFDDGYYEDYTQVHSILSSKGVKGTFYINEIDIPGKLTTPQVIEMANYGHEFGSHTKNHTMLAKLAIHKQIDIGDTEIQVLNQYITPAGPLNVDDDKVYTVVVGSDSSWDFFKVTKGTNYGAYQTLNLVTPATKNIPKPNEIWFAEDSIEYMVTQPKQVLENIGVECVGFAYPFGSGTIEAETVLNKHFTYARNAYLGANPKTFGGYLDGFLRPFNQYRLASYELIDISESSINTFLNTAQSEKSIVCVLGHSSSGATMWNKLSLFIDEVQSRGIEILTMREAMDRYGNSVNVSDFRINSQGGLWGGVTCLPSGFFTSLQNIYDYPQGVTVQQVKDAERIAGGYPIAGTLITVQSLPRNRNYGQGGSRAWWTFQYLIAIDSNEVYARKRSGNIIATDWECVTTRRGTAFPTVARSIGGTFYRTDLKKPFWWDGTQWLDAVGGTV